MFSMNAPAFKKNRRKTLRLVLILTLIGASIAVFVKTNLYVMHAIYPWTRHTYHNDSMEPVDVVLGTMEHLNLRVPGAYFTWLPVDGNGISTMIQIEAYLPDIVPKSIYYAQHPDIAKHDAAAIAALRRSWLYITLSSMGPNGREAFFEQRTYFMESYIPRPYDDNSNFKIYDSVPPFDGKGSDYSYNMSRSSVYIPKDSDSYDVECWGEHTNLYTCLLNFIYEEKIRASVGIDPENISKSDDIRKILGRFLDRVVVPR